MINKQSVVINQICSGWSEQMSFYRFVHNEHVSEEALSLMLQSKCKTGVAGRSHVLAISDSSIIDYSWHRSGVKPGSGLGFIGDHNGWGYNMHSSLVLDPEDRSVLGLSDAHLWHRSVAKSDTKENYYSKPFEEKESYRWVNSCLKSKSALEEVQMCTFVHDSEGDIYDSFVLIPDKKHHLLVRSKYDRRIITPSGEESKLRKYVANQAILGVYQVEVNSDQRKRTAHTAYLELRSTRVRIKRIENAKYHYQYPRSVEVDLVYAKQRPESVPPGEEAIEWYLMTTHRVENFTDAIQIIYWYTLRWFIEDFFRLLKKKGFQLESSELETGFALRRLGILAMDSALQAMQLRQARDGQDKMPIEAVFDPKEVEALEKIGPTLEGNTLKQKNPYPPKSLPWASWIIARLGGWKGYKSQRPPGVITFKRGLVIFKNILWGINLGP